MSAPTIILVIRLSSIGDIVLTTPVLRLLKNQLEGEVEIHYLTKAKFASLLEGNPHITQVHTMEKTVQEVLPALETLGFDYVIDLHHNIRSAVVKRRLKCLAFTYKKYNFRKWLWVNLGINIMPNVHIVDRYIEPIKGFGVTDDKLGLDFYIPEGKGQRDADIPEIMNGRFISFAIGGMHEGKKMSKEKLVDVCKSISHPIVLIGGKDDFDDGSFIASAAGSHVHNACGKWSLHESADAIRRSHLVITGDTGMMHIASAFNKKIISLWGCTVPGFGMSPYRPHPASIILEPIDRKKRPCSKLGNKCKYGMDHKCIDQISTEEISRTIETLWAQ